MKIKLVNNDELKQEYNQVFDNYLKDGLIEKVDDDDDDDDDDYWLVEKTHYLPHWAVAHCDKELTKVCVIFDASMKNGR